MKEQTKFWIIFFSFGNQSKKKKKRKCKRFKRNNKKKKELYFLKIFCRILLETSKSFIFDHHQRLVLHSGRYHYHQAYRLSTK